jgi:plasmid stability protein
MATLQIKRLPDDLHAELKRRAKAEHTTVSELATRMLRRELAFPSMSVWVAMVDAERPIRGRDLDVVAALDEARDEFDPR